jgi:hypothetical protein
MRLIDPARLDGEIGERKKTAGPSTPQASKNEVCSAQDDKSLVMQSVYTGSRVSALAILA